MNDFQNNTVTINGNFSFDDVDLSMPDYRGVNYDNVSEAIISFFEESGFSSDIPVESETLKINVTNILKRHICGNVTYSVSMS